VSNSSADGPWLDLVDAAAYASVYLTDIVGAVGRNELPAVTSLPTRMGDWMVRAREVEAWAERRAAAIAVRQQPLSA
jgi:hypothetical protein